MKEARVQVREHQLSLATWHKHQPLFRMISTNQRWGPNPSDTILNFGAFRNGRRNSENTSWTAKKNDRSISKALSIRGKHLRPSIRNGKCLWSKLTRATLLMFLFVEYHHLEWMKYKRHKHEARVETVRARTHEKKRKLGRELELCKGGRRRASWETMIAYQFHRLIPRLC